MTGWACPPVPAHWAGSAATTFVGRRGELTAIDRVWSMVLAGTPAVVMLCGDAGAGKSRLVVEAGAALHRSGAAIVCGSCAAELGEPYQPFTEAVRALTGPLASGDLPVRPDAAIHGRPLTHWLSLLTGDAADAGPAGGREFQRQMCQAVARLLTAAAAVHPLVVVLEDLHWAGSGGLQLLAYLAGQVVDARLLIVATYRTEPPDRSAALVHHVAGLQRLDRVHRFDLTPFHLAEVTDYLIRAAQLPADAADGAAPLLLAQTAGNPFLLRELCRDLTARGGPAVLRSPVAAPAAVRDMLQARLDRLGSTARRTVEMAAVVGEEFEPATVAAAMDATPDAVLTALDEALREGVCEPVPGTDGRYRFRHALARAAVLDLSSPAAQQRDHARVAIVLARRPVSARTISRIAHHYASAHALGYTDEALRYLLEAAELADRRLAHHDAGGLFERAAAITDDPAARDSHLLRAARSYLLGADFRRARELTEQVATNGVRELRLRAAVDYESASWRTGLAGDRAVDLLRSALRGRPTDPGDPEYVRAVAGLGRALAFTGATDESMAVGEQAITFARHLGDRRLIAEALQASLWTTARPALVTANLLRATELTTLAETIDDLGHLGPAAYHRSVIAYVQGTRTGLDTAQADLSRVARTTGQDYFGYLAGCVTYAQQFTTGRFQDAERTCAGLRSLGRSFGEDGTEGLFGVQSYMIRRETGALAHIRPLISGDESPTEHWAPGLLALYTELGLDRSAARMLRWVLDQAPLQDQDSGQWPMVLVFMTEAALMLGDAETAARLRPALAAHAGRNLLAGSFVAMFGSADRYLGAIDSLFGHGDPEQSFATAYEMDSRMYAPVHQAATLAAHAAHCRRTGTDRGRMAALAARARSIAEPLGLRRTLAMLDRATAPAAEEVRGDRLTRREIEVLRLLADGLNNRQIGARLFITENTAANHVRSILAKTESANRTQAARYAAEHGLSDRDH